MTDSYVNTEYNFNAVAGVYGPRARLITNLNQDLSYGGGYAW